MTPSTKESSDRPVTVAECERKHASTTRVLSWLLTATVPVLGFGITSSVVALVNASRISQVADDVKEVRLDVREIRANQMGRPTPVGANYP